MLHRACCKYLPNLITASSLETPYCTEPVCVGRAHHVTFPLVISEEGAWMSAVKRYRGRRALNMTTPQGSLQWKIHTCHSRASMLNGGRNLPLTHPWVMNTSRSHLISRVTQCNSFTMFIHNRDLRNVKNHTFKVCWLMLTLTKWASSITMVWMWAMLWTGLNYTGLLYLHSLRGPCHKSDTPLVRPLNVPKNSHWCDSPLFRRLMFPKK